MEAATKITAIVDVSAPAVLQLQPQDQQNFVSDVQPLLPPPQTQSIVVDVEAKTPKNKIVKKKLPLCRQILLLLLHLLLPKLLENQ